VKQALKKLQLTGDELPRQHTEPDPRVALVYASNLRSLAALVRTHGTRLVLVPQVLWPAAKNPTPNGDPITRWLPYVSKESLLEQMAVLNDVMADVARKEEIPFAREILDSEWKEADFRDYCHFSPAGCRKFARILSSFLQARDLIPAGHR
jgi:hypothetical protein